MKKTLIRFLIKLLGLCDHEWELGMKNGKIHKVCYKCKTIINTGI